MMLYRCTYGFRVMGFPKLIRHITSRMENQVEKKMQHEMETVIIWDLQGGY